MIPPGQTGRSLSDRAMGMAEIACIISNQKSGAMSDDLLVLATITSSNIIDNKLPGILGGSCVIKLMVAVST